jgi:hypothetical protein
MRLSDLHRRNDLCAKGQLALYHLLGYGCIIKTKRGWWASNETRHDLVGEWSNMMLVQPTLGPHKSAKEALAAYERARGELRSTTRTIRQPKHDKDGGDKAARAKGESQW